jgi:transposase-like protein
MPSNTRRKHSPEFKAALALKLLASRTSVAQLARRYRPIKSTLQEWERGAMEKLPLIGDQHSRMLIITTVCAAFSTSSALGFLWSSKVTP